MVTPIYIQSDAGELAPVAGVDIPHNLFLSNFNGTSWVTFNAAPGSPGIGVDGQITVSGNDFDSDADIAGSCAAKIGMTYTADMVALHGSDLSANGLVANVTIDSNTFNAGYVRGAIAIWSGTKHIDIVHNSIQDAGLRLPMYPDTELGRYAILVYNSAHERPGLHPDAVRIVENTIANPVSCGIYVAAGRNREIRANRISGQQTRSLRYRHPARGCDMRSITPIVYWRSRATFCPMTTSPSPRLEATSGWACMRYRSRPAVAASAYSRKGKYKASCCFLVST